LNNVTFEDNGWYIVKVTDTNNCVNLDSSYILVENSSECFLIPEVVTPNNDGKNDVWHIQGLDPSLSHSIEIFNRWGNRIFNKTEFENDWDCRSNCGIIIDEKNGLVPTGTYFYILKTGGPIGAVYTGSIEIHY
jgi:gliding motility-associated-like protein